MKKEYINVNRNKLHQELANAGIKTIYVGAIDNTEIGCEIIFAENTDMTAVQAVIDAHNPEPLPQEPTEIEKLRQQLTQLEVLTVNNLSNQIENQILKGEI